MLLLVWKHACLLLCSLMALFVFTKGGGCWKSQWREHGCCVQKHPKQSKEKSYSSLPLGQWDSETRPFCCSDKTFILKNVLS